MGRLDNQASAAGGVSGRLQLVLGLGAIALLVSATAPAAARPHAASVAEIYFYANVGNPMPGTKFNPNPPRIRPTTLIEHEDGSWLIVNLKWSSWGGSSARATGISSASNCNPNCADGTRTSDPATLVVSKPKRFLGRTVYSCFRLTIPAAPKANQHECIGRSGSLYIYQPVNKANSSAGTTVHLYSFVSPSRNIVCNLGDEENAWCATVKPPRSVLLHPNGSISVRNGREGADSSGLATVPVLAYGQQDVYAGYRCRSAQVGVTCTNIKSRRGFLISRSGVKRVGP
jgi:hypothetical protein